jgi:heat shock protein HslJ
MTRFARAAFPVPLLVVLFLAACAGGDSGGAGGPTGSASPTASPPGAPGALPWGRAFIATAATQGGKPRPFVAGARVTLRFDEGGRVGLSAGCNSMGGTGRLDEEGRLIVEGLAMTDIACDPPRHQQDEWLAEFLSSRPAWRLEGNTSTLTSGDTELRLTDRREIEPDRALVGTQWMVDTFVSGDSASSVPQGAQAHLTFGGDGSVTGSNGCNSLTGRARVEADRITLSNLAATAKACDGAAGDLGKTVMSVLQQRTLTYRVEANRLTLTAPDGTGLGLVG